MGRTSDNQRRNERPEPELVPIREIFLVMAVFAGLLVFALYFGNHTWGWSQVTTSLVIAGGVFGILLMWWLIRTILVRYFGLPPALIGKPVTEDRRRR